MSRRSTANTRLGRTERPAQRAIEPHDAESTAPLADRSRPPPPSPTWSVARTTHFIQSVRPVPRAHQQQCRSNIVEFYKLNDSFDKVECCFHNVERRFDIDAVFGNNVERVFREISSFRQSRNKLNMFNIYKSQNPDNSRHVCGKPTDGL